VARTPLTNAEELRFTKTQFLSERLGFIYEGRMKGRNVFFGFCTPDCSER